MEKLGRFYVNTAGGEVVGGESDGNSLTYLGKIEKVTTNYHKFSPFGRGPAFCLLVGSILALICAAGLNRRRENPGSESSNEIGSLPQVFGRCSFHDNILHTQTHRTTQKASNFNREEDKVLKEIGKRVFGSFDNNHLETENEIPEKVCRMLGQKLFVPNRSAGAPKYASG